MAFESALSAVSAAYINTLKLGYINMLKNYGLVKQMTNTGKALDYAVDLLKNPDTAQNSRNASQEFLKNKIDVTNYVVRAIESTKENKDLFS